MHQPYPVEAGLHTIVTVHMLGQYSRNWGRVVRVGEQDVWGVCLSAA